MRIKKKTLWQIREFKQWGELPRPLGRKLRSSKQCDKIVKRLTRNSSRELYVAPIVIHCY